MTMHNHLNICALLLAAGSSKRFGTENKLQKMIGGQTLLHKSIALLENFEYREKRIVVRPDDNPRIPKDAKNLQIVVNAHAVSGLASSFICGMATLTPGWSGVLIHLADKPFVKKKTIDFLIREFVRFKCQKICLPVFNGMHGHPVIFPASMQEGLLALQGDTGGRELLERFPSIVRRIEVDDPAILEDINTMEDFAYYKKREEGNAT